MSDEHIEQMAKEHAGLTGHTVKLSTELIKKVILVRCYECAWGMGKLLLTNVDNNSNT